jgi:hypothetical protein
MKKTTRSILALLCALSLIACSVLTSCGFQKEDVRMKQHISISKLDPNKGVLDFSHLLDAPAGCHGFVQTKDGHFYFEDGTRARFIGFNIATRSNTPDHETAERLAERFAGMGVNVIRLHAADAPIGDEPGSWSSCREAPLLDYDKGTTRVFNPEGLDRFDYLIAQLKERGIYLHIDLIVARGFLEGDGLDYPGSVPSCMKRYPMYNERLIELQKEYACELLCHVNPYTGLALKDDPAVITVQINNEESAIKGNNGADASESMQPYREEVLRRFGDFLLDKYGSREALAEAWTFEDACALGEDEDPALGTVRGIEGGFYQSVGEPMGQWNAAEGPARYADWMEFGAIVNRDFYREMKGYLISLGVKVPIVASNLMAGAADVYGHTDGDLMENNTYFNHPILPVQNENYMVYGPTEYVSTNPLTVQLGVGSMGTTLVSLASVAIVNGKPFMLSEWNEYGLHPFHSTAFVHTVAYACLNDWDGLILYNFCTSEKDNQPADRITNIFDAYNDPALIAQWGFMASVFLKGLISPAKNRVDVVYTPNDWKTLPNFNAMPMCFLPYVTSLRNIFLEDGETYSRDADLAVNAGFLNDGDLSAAEHAVYYAWSPYRDPMRRELDENRLRDAARDSRELQSGVHLGTQNLVFDNITETAHYGDYREFATLLNSAMKEWGLLDAGTGYVEGKLISDTGEICFDPDHARFSVCSAGCGYFSGAPEEETVLSDKVTVRAANKRISLALLPLDSDRLDSACEFLLTAIGTSGTDAQSFNPGPELMPGLRFTMVRMDGKLYAETLEGSLSVRASSAKLIALDPVGRELGEIAGEKHGDRVVFSLLGDLPGIQYHISIED